MPNCEICGEPMPPGEEMFKFHGYSGPCPKAPLVRKSDMPDQKKPSPGRIVHYVLPEPSFRKGAHRAAIVTSDWSSDNINLNVQLDQSDDWCPGCAEAGLQRTGDFTARAWSAPYDGDAKLPGTWHWPEIAVA